MRRDSNNRRGFTLTEILVALAIFALGGTAIMALFITNVRLARQAMDFTRAAELTRNIRSLMTESLSRPIPVNDTDNIYAFYYPDSSLTFNPNEYLDYYEGGKLAKTATADRDALKDNIGGSPALNTVFFRLPKNPYDANIQGDAQKNVVTEIPRDALNSSGDKKNFDIAPRCFRLLPDHLRRVGAVEGLDPDDRMFYQFDISVRRSVQRSGATRPDGAKQPLDDLYVVHVKIYKGFEFEGDVINDPYFEWDFYINGAK
jgi:prepilin-type N-terminal cleavage/methylation domain-containing protein